MKISAIIPSIQSCGRRTFLFLTGLLMTFCALCAPASAQDGASLYSGGTIITMEGDTPQMAEAVLVRNGQIIAVGDEKTLKARAANMAPAASVRQVDLKGRTMLPGFIDAHGHLSFYGLAASWAKLSPPPLGTVDSIAALQVALKAYIEENDLPEGQPVIGFGYDDSQLAEKRHPTRSDLDVVSGGRPMLITHTSGHLAVMNSAMLKLARITADTKNPEGGIIRREADGKTPNGVLEENALFNITAMLAPKGGEAALRPIERGAQGYIEFGVTTVQDGRVEPSAWPNLVMAADQRKLPVDTVVLLGGERKWSDEVRQQIGGDYKNRLRIAGIKLSLDGSPQGRTAWLKDPVPVPPKGAEAGYHGYPSFTQDELYPILKEAAENDWQVFAHVNGDAAAQQLIDGVRANGLAGKRTIAIHNQVTTLEQLREMKELDIQPSFFVSHTYFWGDWHRDVALGPKRADFISPLASALAVGLRPTIHNDTPVTPPDMMRLVWSAVNRRTQSGDILGPLERVSAYDALKMVTINAAWQIHEDDDKGSIAPGKRADFVMLDANPLSVDPAKIADIKVLATVKDGKTIYGSLD
ncbi:amidohydrolase [Parasphingorhabdus sp. JC815]|uniref:amidohydrolase n=1 Tax=Parasphingorhabdus sp. JC815 TaxID=3232140 RepID=UPI0034589764